MFVSTLSLSIVAHAILAAVLLYLAVKDIRERRVPNEVILALVVVWAAWRAVLAICDPSTLAATGELALFALVVFAGLLVLGVVYERLRGRPAMGGGDVKLISAMALYLGAYPLAVCVVAACAVALVFALVPALAAKARPPRQSRGIPFATCLCCGLFAAYLLA